MVIAQQQAEPQNKGRSLKYLQQKAQGVQTTTLASPPHTAEIKPRVYNRVRPYSKNLRTPASRLAWLTGPLHFSGLTYQSSGSEH